MRRLDRFILKSFIGPFLAILLVVMFILVMQFLWVYIDELVNKGLSFSVILEFLMWGGCTILPLAMPLATLLASMWTIGQMSENNELIAVKSAGISLVRIMSPLFVASAIISVLAFYSANDLVPIAYDKIYTLRDDINKTKDEIKIPSGIFYDGIEGYVLRVDGRNDDTGMMYGVMVYDHTTDKGNLRLTVADSGLMKMSKAKDYLTFQLYDGTNYQETNTRKYRDTTLALQRIHFARQEMVIPLENYSFHHSDSARYGEQVRSMSNEQLRHGRDSLARKSDEGAEKFMQELRSSYALQWQSQLDSGWKDPAKKPFDLSKEPARWEDPERRKQAYESALSNVHQIQSTIQTQGMEAYEYSRLLRLSEVEIWKKYAQALACFILFFIGAPIGSLIRKGGLGTPAVVSILFFVLYWVVDISGTKLARDGATTPFIGDFISAFVLIPIGVFLTWMAIREKSINLDAFKTWRRKFFSKIMSLFKKTRIVYMGTPEFAVAPLDALTKGRGYKVVGVVTVADKPSGRGLKVNESAVKKYAVANGIPVLQPDKLKDPAFLEALAAWKADLFVVVGFRMLPEMVWKMPRMGTFNLHAALLPQYRGAAPINWAVINGENLTGVTTFMIDQKIDTGGILLRQECRVEPTDTAGDVHDKLMAIGADLVVQTVEGLIQKNVETRVQRSFVQGSEVLKPAPKLTRELQHIDWDDTTRNIYNLVRGLSPFPGAFTELVKDGQATQLKVFFGEIRSDLHAAPGTVLSDGKTYLAVATQDGALALTDVQLAGKKRMDVKAFLLGFREPETYTTSKGTSKAEILKTKPEEEDA